MSNKPAMALLALLALAACSTSQPRIIQASMDSPNVTLNAGMATQIEMPDEGRVQSLVVGNPALLTAEQSGDVVNLTAKEGAEGETNLIIRARGEDGRIQVYQYHVTVQKP